MSAWVLSQRDDSFEFLAQKSFSPRKISSPCASDDNEFPFLQASHSFDASSLPSAASNAAAGSCLSFSKADVVFVHWKHHSGWADVTCFTTGKRGWAPLNYFGAFTQSKAIPLLSAAANLIQRPKESGSGQGSKYDPQAFSPGALNELVSGVRHLLTKTQCLDRHSTALQDSKDLKRLRKLLLTELTFLVRTSKQQTPEPEALARSAFRVVQKGLHLLDRFKEENLFSSQKDSDDETRERTRRLSFDVLSAVPTAEARINDVSVALCEYLGVLVHKSSELVTKPTAGVEILLLTRRCMLSCRELLVVLEAVSAASLPRNAELDSLHAQLSTQIRAVLAASRQLVASLSLPQDTLKMMAQTLAGNARQCSQVVLECSMWCQELLKRHTIDLPTRTYPDVRALSATSKHFKSVSASSTSSQDSSFSQTSAHTAETTLSIPLSKESPDQTLDDETLHEDETLHNDTQDTQVTQDTQDTQDTPNDTHDTHDTDASNHSRESSCSSLVSLASISRFDAQVEAIHPELLVRKNKVLGGSFPALVCWMLSTFTTSFNRHAFLLSFRLFSTPLDLANQLLAELKANESAAQSLPTLLSIWFESFWRVDDEVAAEPLGQMVDLLKCSELEELLQARLTSHKDSNHMVLVPLGPYCRSHCTDSASTCPSTACQSTTSLSFSSRRGSAANVFRGHRRLSQDDLRGLAGASFSSLRFGTRFAAVGSKILDHDPEVVAAQLTLLDAGCLALVCPDELLDQRFSASKRSSGLAPNLVALIQLSNHLTAFVGESVLGPENLGPKTLRNIIRFWIKVADACLELGNFNTLMTIVNSLQSSNISRLKKVWDLVGDADKTALDRLAKLVSPHRNFSEYREELRKRSQTRCIPYIGLYLSDLTFINEGNPKTRVHNSRPVINIDRYLRSVDIISGLQSFQRMLPYVELTPNTPLQTWLKQEMAKSHSDVSKDYDLQWRRSRVIEPN